MSNFLTQLFRLNSARSLKIETQLSVASQQKGFQNAASPQASLRQVTKGAALEVDECYVRIRLDHTSIPFHSIGTRGYYACVHSWMALQDERPGNARFQVFAFNKVGDMDGAHPDGVLVRNMMLLNSAPYRGDLRIQIGLFSVEANGTDLLEAYLTLLKSLSDAAGVGIASQAVHFVHPIQEGLNLLLGAGKNLTLEVGLDDRSDPLVTGTYLLARAPLRDIDCLIVDEEYRLRDPVGAVVSGIPYLVFSIIGLRHRNDWRSIPDIASSHQTLKSFFLGTRIDEQSGRDQLRHFKMTCLNSPDLIRKDARAIADREAEAYRKFLPRHKMAGAEKGSIYPLWELLDLHPFCEEEEVF
jgi:hypothetical protein